jgi:nucleotide-binding universal stress UspA family protein
MVTSTVKHQAMKKFIVAFDGLKFSESAAKYAVYLAKMANAHLTGVFLEDFTYHSYKIYELASDDIVIEEKRTDLEAADNLKRSQAVDAFVTTCKKEDVNFSVHHDRNIAKRELLEESIYADLLIISSKETLTHYEENLPTRFVKDLLENTQCPVFVVPGDFQPFEKLIMLYDGHPSSVYAIKAFRHLFSSQEDMRVEVFTVNDETNHKSLNFRLLKELLKHSFQEVSYKTWEGDPETLIAEHIKNMKLNPLVVTGAYHRGMVSRWFRSSMADRLMKDLECPLFIAHN